MLSGRTCQFYLIISHSYYAENIIRNEQGIKTGRAWCGVRPLMPVVMQKIIREVSQMNYTTLAIGLLAFFFGICTLFLRVKHPQTFSKLNAMKERYGEKAGAAIHTISYTILPIIAGIIFIIIGFMGESIF
jgi:hypothetical protein